MAVPAAFLDELRSRIPIRPIVERKVTLERSGRNWKGCCPFHVEKSPSFYVYDDHFHCFGCGAHGDVISYLAQAEKIPVKVAIKRLADDAGLSIPGAEDKAADLAEAIPATRTTRLDESSKNVTIFKDSGIEAILGTAAKVLVRNGQRLEAALLANGDTSLTHWNHDNWNGGQDTWRLHIAIAVDTYLELEHRDEVEKTIAKAIALPMTAVSDSDDIEVSLTTALEENPDWRRRTQEHLGGRGITNQGRVRSDNIASIEHKGLRFRSRPELFFYMAMGSTGLPFAPLPVVVIGGAQPRRIEPDFVIWSQGVTMLVEIDGDNFHSEKPVEAHARLKFLLDEGVFMERINSSECDTEVKARHAVARIVETIRKRKAAK